MLERHLISNEFIIKCLRDNYGINAHTVTFLPIGADAKALVYKVDAADKSYFVKLRKSGNNDHSIAIINLLKGAGLKQIICPIANVEGQSILYTGDLSITVYPFVVGDNGFNQSLSEEQWLILGQALRKLHKIHVPTSLQQKLRNENYSPKWREAVRFLYAKMKIDPAIDKVALEFQNHLREKAEVIRKLVNNAEVLAQELRNTTSQLVLCHADIHAGNVLIDANGAIYIVDWDDPMMAPKERDLMFIGGGIGNVWNRAFEEDLFYKSYGTTEVKKVILAYYRNERIVEDIAEFAESILFSESSHETKQENYNYFKAMFEPNGVVDIAFRTMDTSI